MKIKYPRPIKSGDMIGITAPSSGVQSENFSRLDVVLNNLRAHEFHVVEGSCLRKNQKHVSGNKTDRAAELMQFWRDPDIRAIMPPWGGEILTEILPLVDFEEIKTLEPKWISGYSDISTLLLPLTLVSGIATVHGSNLMDLTPRQSDPLTTGLLGVFKLSEGSSFVQHSSTLFQSKYIDFKIDPEAPLNLTETTQWKVLNKASRGQLTFSGRIIGGCLDTISRLVGTKYCDVPKFCSNVANDGTILYFENCEMSPCELVRALWNIKFAGWFDKLNGVLIGRSTGPNAKSTSDLSYVESIESVLGDIDAPVLYDVDIGHQPPQFNIVNGALANVVFQNGKGSLTTKLI